MFYLLEKVQKYGRNTGIKYKLILCQVTSNLVNSENMGSHKKNNFSPIILNYKEFFGIHIP
jgi:hypothetical protein